MSIRHNHSLSFNQDDEDDFIYVQCKHKMGLTDIVRFAIATLKNLKRGKTHDKLRTKSRQKS